MPAANPPAWAMEEARRLTDATDWTNATGIAAALAAAYQRGVREATTGEPSTTQDKDHAPEDKSKRSDVSSGASSKSVEGQRSPNETWLD